MDGKLYHIQSGSPQLIVQPTSEKANPALPVTSLKALLASLNSSEAADLFLMLQARMNKAEEKSASSENCSRSVSPAGIEVIENDEQLLDLKIIPEAGSSSLVAVNFGLFRKAAVAKATSSGDATSSKQLTK